MKEISKDCLYTAVPFGADVQEKRAVVEDGGVPLLGEAKGQGALTDASCSSSRVGWRRICGVFLRTLAVVVVVHVVLCGMKHCHRDPRIPDNHPVSPHSQTSTSYFDYEKGSGHAMAPPPLNHGPPGPFPRPPPPETMDRMIKRPKSMFMHPLRSSDSSSSSRSSSDGSSTSSSFEISSDSMDKLQELSKVKGWLKHHHH